MSNSWTTSQWLITYYEIGVAWRPILGGFNLAGGRRRAGAGANDWQRAGSSKGGGRETEAGVGLRMLLIPMVASPWSIEHRRDAQSQTVPGMKLEDQGEDAEPDDGLKDRAKNVVGEHGVEGGWQSLCSGTRSA